MRDATKLYLMIPAQCSLLCSSVSGDYEAPEVLAVWPLDLKKVQKRDADIIKADYTVPSKPQVPLKIVFANL
jgi:hypothetical protein